MTPVRRASAGALALVVAFGLAGCDGAARPDPSATQLPDGISAVLVPSAAPDEALVRVTNDSDQLLMLGSMRIDDPRFQWAAWSRDLGEQSVAEGTTALVSVRLPDVRCDTATPGPTRVTVQYSLGASIAVASAAISDPSGVVTARAAALCGG